MRSAEHLAAVAGFILHGGASAWAEPAKGLFAVYAVHTEFKDCEIHRQLLKKDRQRPELKKVQETDRNWLCLGSTV